MGSGAQPRAGRTAGARRTGDRVSGRRVGPMRPAWLLYRVWCVFRATAQWCASAAGCIGSPTSTSITDTRISGRLPCYTSLNPTSPIPLIASSEFMLHGRVSPQQSAGPYPRQRDGRNPPASGPARWSTHLHERQGADGQAGVGDGRGVDERFHPTVLMPLVADLAPAVCESGARGRTVRAGAPSRRRPTLTRCSR
jgi:hypothetical protein